MLNPQMCIQDGDQRVAKKRTPGHPLVIPTTSVLIRTEKPALRKDPHEPREEIDVVGVHSKRDLRLTPITPEMTLSHQKSHQKADIEQGGLDLRLRTDPSTCSLDVHQEIVAAGYDRKVALGGRIENIQHEGIVSPYGAP